MPAPETLYERLRRLAVEDPKRARDLFLEAFEADSEELGDFLRKLQRPSEGRLRQVTANAVKTHPEKHRLVPALLRWRETETDEFARRAIEGALIGVQAASAAGMGIVGARSEVAEVYRYVASRL